MLVIKSALALALLAPSALAGFIIIQTTSYITDVNAAQASSIKQKFDAAESSYAASVTTGSAYNHAWDEIRAYQSTGKESMPAAVTATDRVVTYTTTPAWYTALPSDVKQFFASVATKEQELAASAIKAVKGDAPRPTGRGVYVGGAMAAVVAGVAAVL